MKENTSIRVQYNKENIYLNLRCNIKDIKFLDDSDLNTFVNRVKERLEDTQVIVENLIIQRQLQDDKKITSYFQPRSSTDETIIPNTAEK